MLHSAPNSGFWTLNSSRSSGKGVGPRWAPTEAIRLLIVLGATFPSLQPLMNRGLQDGTYDAAYHLDRLLDLDLTFRAGDLFPWIAPHLALDFGYSTFTFYAPLGLFLGEAFHLFGLGYIASLKASFVAAMLAASLGSYLLARDLFGWRAAMAASIAYAYVPYRLLDVYVGGDLAEAVAQAALPFAFWGLWRVVNRPAAGPAAVAGVGLGALLLAHNITALFAAPLLVAFLAVSLIHRWSRAALIGLAAAGLLGLALGGIYWLPVLTQLGDVNMTALTAGQFDFHREFLPWQYLIQHTWTYDYRLLPSRGAMYNLGLAQAVLTVLAFLWILVARPRGFAVLLFAAIGGSILVWMQQSGSVFVWDHLPMARFIQYQTRLSSYIGLLSALILGGLVSERGAGELRIGPLQIRPGPLLVVETCLEFAVILLFARASLAAMPRHNAPMQESEVNLPTVWSEENATHLIVGNTQGDYLPATVRATFFQNAASRIADSPTSTPVRLTALWSAPLVFEARSSSDASSTILFDILDYPGWQATIDGRVTKIREATPRGEVRIVVPEGQHRIRISDPGTLADRLGAWASLGGLVVVALVIVAPSRGGWRRRLAWLALALTLVAVALVSQLRPPLQMAGGVDFGNSVRLVGSRLDRVPGSQPGAIDVTLIWEGLRAPLPDCTVHLVLQDAAGQVVARRDKAPLFGRRPCSSWLAGEIVRDHQQIRLPPGVQPGPYRLSVGITLGNTALSPSVDGSDVSASGSVPAAPQDNAFTSIGLVDAPGSPPPAMLPGSFPVGATIGNAFLLDAARVVPRPASGPDRLTSSDRRFVARISPGDSLSVDLRWRSLVDTSVDYAVFVHLIDADQHLVAQRDNFPDHENFPTTVWFPGDTLVDDYRLDTSPRLAPGVYTIGAGMYTRGDLKDAPVRGPGSAGYQAVVGQVKVSIPSQVFGQPRPISPLDATFGGQITLFGAALAPPAPSAAAPLRVTLAWRDVVQPSTDYTAFVHVLSPAGQLVAQHDSQPLGGTYPTSDWDPGDRIFDTVAVPLPPSLPPGRYTVEAGLYRLETGARLALPNGATAIVIGTLVRE